jgi:hypothetical protein
MAGLWNATSVFTRRTTMPCSVQSLLTSSTAATVPEITVDSGEALIAATTSERAPRRSSASAKRSRTNAIAPSPMTDRNPRAR